jgi:hypothetical protein
METKTKNTELNTPPESPKVSRFLNRPLFWIVGLLLLITVSGLIAWFQTMKLKDQVAQKPNVVTQKAEALKTYENTSYGFEFKYPESYSLKESHNHGLLGELTLTIPDNNNYEYIQFNFANDSSIASGKLICAEQPDDGPGCVSFIPKTICPQAICTEEGVDHYSHYKVATFPKVNGLYFEFQYRYAVLDQKTISDGIKVFDQIVSSFKITR